MKKYLLSLLALVGLVGCSHGDLYNTNRETRYFAYVGEPAAVLYDNFGTPYKGIRYSATEHALVFHTQDIEREWAYSDYRYCDITFYLTNNIVTGWEMTGNQCAINEEETSFFDRVFADKGNQAAFNSGSMDSAMFTTEDTGFDGFADMFSLGDEFGANSAAPMGSSLSSGTYAPAPVSQPYAVPNAPAGHVIADDAF